MNVDDLLQQLADREVNLFLDGDRLRFRAPEGVLTPALRAAIAVSRNTIIERLRAVKSVVARHRCTTCDRWGWVDDPPQAGRIRTTCGTCGRFIGYRPVEL